MRRVIYLIILSILLGGCTKKPKTPKDMFANNKNWEEINKGGYR